MKLHHLAYHNVRQTSTQHYVNVWASVERVTDKQF